MWINTQSISWHANLNPPKIQIYQLTDLKWHTVPNTVQLVIFEGMHVQLVIFEGLKFYGLVS